MPNLLDVARHAGVSPMTVSRVVNGSGPVSPALRARVEQALAETGYMPNTLARNLRARRTDTIALLLPDMTNPFFTTLAQGVETAAREAGITLLLANSDEREDEERRLVPMLLQRQVDGLLVVPAGTGEETVRALPRPGRPAGARRPASAGRGRGRRPGRLRGRVRSSSGALLVGLGHRHMAVLSGPADRPHGRRPRRGLPQGGRGRGRAPGADRAARGLLDRERARRWRWPRWRRVPRPTALFAANNFIAIGVAARARRSSASRVPEDVAVVGFDDLPEAMVTFPFLTVVAQPAVEMGRRAVAVLLERLANPSGPAQDVVLPTELVIRRSSGGPVAEPAR